MTPVLFKENSCASPGGALSLVAARPSIRAQVATQVAVRSLQEREAADAAEAAVCSSSVQIISLLALGAENLAPHLKAMSIFRYLPHAARVPYAEQMLLGKARPFDVDFFSDPQNPMIVRDALSMYRRQTISQNELAQAILAHTLSNEENVIICQAGDAQSLLMKFFIYEQSKTISATWEEKMKTAILRAFSQVDVVHQMAFLVKVGAIPEQFTKPLSRGFLPMALSFDETCWEFVVIPPPLFQALLSCLFPKTAVRIDSLIGLPLRPKLSDTSQRPLSLSTPECPVPVVHGLNLCTHAWVSLHDMYHCLIESANPFRKECVQIFTMLQGLAREWKDPEGITFLKHLADMFLDRDMSFIDLHIQLEEVVPFDLAVREQVFLTRNLVEGTLEGHFWYQISSQICFLLREIFKDQEDGAAVRDTQCTVSEPTLQAIKAALRGLKTLPFENPGILESRKFYPRLAALSKEILTPEFSLTFTRESLPALFDALSTLD